MSLRSVIRYVAAGLTGAIGTLVLVVPMLNVQRLAESKGWDLILTDLVSGDPSAFFDWTHTTEAQIIAACVASFTVGIWLDWFLKTKEPKGTWYPPPNPDKEIKEALDLIYTHVGSFGYGDYLTDARSTISSHLVNYVREPHTQELLKFVAAGCIALTSLDSYSWSDEKRNKIESTLKECCVILINNFGKRPRARDKVYMEFIQTRMDGWVKEQSTPTA